MELMLLYFWLKLNTIITFLIIISALLIVIGVLCVFSYLDNSTYERPITLAGSFKAFSRAGMLGVLTLVLAFGIPNRTETAILVGANYAFKAAETPEAQKVMTLIRKKANELLDEELEKNSKEKK